MVWLHVLGKQNGHMATRQRAALPRLGHAVARGDRSVVAQAGGLSTLDGALRLSSHFGVLI